MVQQSFMKNPGQFNQRWQHPLAPPQPQPGAPRLPPQPAAAAAGGKGKKKKGGKKGDAAAAAAEEEPNVRSVLTACVLLCVWWWWWGGGGARWMSSSSGACVGDTREEVNAQVPGRCMHACRERCVMPAWCVTCHATINVVGGAHLPELTAGQKLKGDRHSAAAHAVRRLWQVSHPSTFGCSATAQEVIQTHTKQLRP